MSVTYDSAQALDLAAATYDQLKARFVDLATVFSTVDGERKGLAAEIQRREQAAIAASSANALTDEQKAILKGIL